MSDTDSFIEEVTEEVRRDRLFGYVRRYGWIAGLAVLLAVGAAGFNEYRHARDDARARALGDAMLAALAADGDAARADALAAISAETPGGAAVLALATAGAQARAGRAEDAARTLAPVARSPDLPPIYREIAAFNSLLARSATLDAAARRRGFEELAAPGAALRAHAEEQLALIDIEAGDAGAAVARLRAILEDAEAPRA